ncbi:MAG: hypothetical protein WC951_12935 [Bacteroidales bacterium]
MNNNGHENEVNIISVLNRKTINELPKHFNVWLIKLFKEHDKPMFVYKLNNHQKADIGIKVNRTTKYISIKSGANNSFHSEPIEYFIPFLRSIGVREHTLKTIVFFHYGDNTLDGTGQTRFTSREMRRTMNKFFKLASKELSETKIIKEVIMRTIIKGRFAENVEIDGIYHGTAEAGFFLPKNLIYKILLREKYVRYNGTINIKFLSYQPGCRNLYSTPGAEEKRGNSVIKWRSFIKDATNELKFQ